MTSPTPPYLPKASSPNAVRGVFGQQHGGTFSSQHAGTQGSHAAMEAWTRETQPQAEGQLEPPGAAPARWEAPLGLQRALPPAPRLCPPRLPDKLARNWPDSAGTRRILMH